MMFSLNLASTSPYQGAGLVGSPPPADQLRREALRALEAWQTQLKAEGDEKTRLEELIASLASQKATAEENARVDASIREEWRKLHPPEGAK